MNARGRRPRPAHGRASFRAALAVVGLSTLAFAAPAAAITDTFEHTGAAQTWTVPAGVTSATFDLYGAQGGGAASGTFAAGRGGRATATISVTPGDSIQVNVGGQGVGSTGGFNGGGQGLQNGGGGASDIRIGGTTLADRVLVAGGGGGAGELACGSVGSAAGGGGGGESGLPGGTSGCPSAAAGGGGTQDATGGTATSPATPGVFGVGGDGGVSPDPPLDGSGGGGGWFGGGGGLGAAGGGGSGHGPAGTLFEAGVRSGNGLVTVTYTVSAPPVDGTPPPVGGTPPPLGGPPALPDNSFSFGKLKRNLDKGTAKLTVNVPGGGQLELAKTKKVKADDEPAEAAGKEKLVIKPKGKAKKKLNQTGKAKVKAKVTYTPIGGEPNTETRKVTLKLG